MKKSTKIILMLVAILIVIGIMTGSYFLADSDTPIPTPTNSPTEPPTVPTAIPTVTSTPTPTLTNTPTPEPTSTPTPEPTVTPTPTPPPLPTPTPTPTSTPTPTPEPTPTPILKPDCELLKSVQMGDDVYYHFYENGTLLVSGTGSTWDFEDEEERDDVIDKAPGETWNGKAYIGTVIIIEEGISRIGSWALRYPACKKVVIPSTLTEIASKGFYECGYNSKELNGCETTWIGLDLSKITVGDMAFTGASGLDNIEESKPYSATPTPLPTATPTPTPNPEQPKILTTVKGGENVTYEFWDNKVVKITGSGATYDFSYDGALFWAVENNRDYGFNTIIVEEGITYLGSFSWMLYAGGGPLYVEFPSTLTGMHADGIYPASVFTVSGYKNGEKNIYEYDSSTDLRKARNDFDAFIESLGITFKRRQ